MWETFSKAPIVEAVFSVNVEHSAPIEGLLDEFANRLPAIFNSKETKSHFEGQFTVENDEMSAGTKKYFYGNIHKCDGENKLIQALADGFSFNKLQPYESWDAFVTEAKTYFGIYLEVFKPVKITRIGLRYINRISIPLPIESFKDYILTVPEVAPNMPNGLSELFMRLVIPKPGTDYFAIVTEAIEPIADGILPFIFDLDIVLTKEFTTADESFWNTVNEMREYKNEIFFNSLTEKSKELFK